MLRTAFLAFSAFGAIRGALLGGSHPIIEEEIDLLILEHMKIVIQPEIMGNIYALWTGQAIAAGRAANGQHFLVCFRHLIDQSQILGRKGIGSSLAGDFQIFPELGHGIHTA